MGLEDILVPVFSLLNAEVTTGGMFHYVRHMMESSRVGSRKAGAAQGGERKAAQGPLAHYPGQLCIDRFYTLSFLDICLMLFHIQQRSHVDVSWEGSAFVLVRPVHKTLG